MQFQELSTDESFSSLVVKCYKDRGKSKSRCCAIQEHGWFYITMGYGKGKGRASVEQVMATSQANLNLFRRYRISQ